MLFSVLYCTEHMRSLKQNALPAGDPAPALALQTYTFLMGVTQTWLFSPRLFSLRQQKDYFHRKCMASLSMSAD